MSLYNDIRWTSAIFWCGRDHNPWSGVWRRLCFFLSKSNSEQTCIWLKERKSYLAEDLIKCYVSVDHIFHITCCINNDIDFISAWSLKAVLSLIYKRMKWSILKTAKFLKCHKTRTMLTLQRSYYSTFRQNGVSVRVRMPVIHTYTRLKWKNIQ